MLIRDYCRALEQCERARELDRREWELERKRFEAELVRRDDKYIFSHVTG